MSHTLHADAATEETLTREEILEIMDRVAYARRNVSAQEILDAYAAGTLEAPGEVIEVLSLARLLS
jgi:hypothetical protein